MCCKQSIARCANARRHIGYARRRENARTIPRPFGSPLTLSLNASPHALTDLEFPQDMHRKDTARIAIQKSIEIGHGLGMKVIAEAVETSEQLEFLRANHFDMAQGYLFSRTLPPPQMLDWLDRHQ